RAASIARARTNIRESRCKAGRFVLSTRGIERRFFFFQGYVAHRVLHSFPTRRSSDLDRYPGSGPGSYRYLSARQGERLPAGQRRSEEHTSELQSRENLVCRLLLEKKKSNLTNCTNHTMNNRTSMPSLNGTRLPYLSNN